MSEWGEQMWSLWNTKVISSASSSWIISRQSSSVLPCYLFISAIKQTQETACRYLSVNTIKCWILNICHATITIAVTVDFVKMKVITLSSNHGNGWRADISVSKVRVQSYKIWCSGKSYWNSSWIEYVDNWKLP